MPRPMRNGTASKAADDDKQRMGQGFWLNRIANSQQALAFGVLRRELGVGLGGTFSHLVPVKGD